MSTSGDLYISDSRNGVIRKVSNGIITTVASGFMQPTAIAIDDNGNLYVADGLLIKKVTDGVVTTIAGGGSTFGDGGQATSAQLTLIGGIAVDRLGRVYISDIFNNRVRVLTPNQAACTYSVDQSSFFESSAGGSFNVSLHTQQGCAWIVEGVPSWLTPSSLTALQTPRLLFVLEQTWESLGQQSF